MKKLFGLALAISISIAADLKVDVVGIWKFTSINQSQPLHIVGSIGHGITLKFNDDGTLEKVQNKSLVSTIYVWNVKSDGQIHIKSKPSFGNFISNFILKSQLNDYIKAEESLGNDCYKVEVTHSNSKKPAKMCKINE
jgi:WD40 repeat protein